MENLATADPENSFNLNDGKYHSDFSYVCRFALGVAIYAAVSLAQVGHLELGIQLKICCHKSHMTDISFQVNFVTFFAALDFH